MKCLLRRRQVCFLVVVAAVLMAGVSLQAQTDPPTLLALDNSDPFVVGEEMTLGVTLPDGPSYDRPWVGMYDSEGSQATWQRTDGNNPLTFVAPALEGNYEFRVFDRDAGTYLMDTIEFNVQGRIIRRVE